MLDRASVEAYDTLYQSKKPLKLSTRDVRAGFWSKARIVAAEHEEAKFDKEYDVVAAGGGPSGMLYAAMLAQRGYKVLLTEIRENTSCCSTWNLSRTEFEDLCKSKALTDSQWQELILGEFDKGVFRIHDGSAPGSQREFRFDKILNISLDEAKFMGLLAETKGLTVCCNCAAELARITKTAVYLSCGSPGRDFTVKARLFIDARGWTSPLAALVHPARKTESVFNMVGVHLNAELAREISPDTGRPIGIICATFENEMSTPAGYVQPILERFSTYVKGRIEKGEVIYYFTRSERPAPLSPVLDEMLSKIHQIVPGFAESHVDATYYGHCPGYHAPGPFSRWGIQTSAGDRTLFVGCAAQQYSGLTGCAFGPIARNAARIADEIAAALNDDKLTFRRLNRIDIDPRERVSQSIEGLFGGAMLLGPGEKPGTVNRDWTAFNLAAEKMDQELKNEAFRDKVRLKTLDQLVGICAGDGDVVRALLRNNRGHIATVIWTFLTAYLKLFLLESGLLLKRRDRKYFAGASGALADLPRFLISNATVFSNAHRIQQVPISALKGTTHGTR